MIIGAQRYADLYEFHCIPSQNVLRISFIPKFASGMKSLIIILKAIIAWWKSTSLLTKVLLIFCMYALITTGFSNYTIINWQRLIHSDMYGYYQWLPSTLIEHTPLDQPYAFILEDGTRFNRYTYGVSILILPFFLISHVISLAFGLPTTGYSPVYGASMVLAAVSWVFFGLYLLYREISRHFSKEVTFLSLFILFLGSNLFYYTAVESGMSHAFSFFLIAAIVYLTPRFWSKPSVKNTVLLSLPFALAVLIRPTNLVLAFFILLHGIHSWKSLKERIFQSFLLWDRWIIMAFIGFIFWIPQSFYWHGTTGDWITWPYKYSYTPDETFRNLNNPRIFKVLAGPRSGWLLYSPVMLFAFLGLFRLVRINKYHIWGILLSFGLIYYLNASWWIYTFACSFGYRAFVDFYSLLAIPFAASVAWLLNRRSKVLKASVLLVCGLFIFVNLRMSYIYCKNPCWDGKYWGWPQYNMVWNKALMINQMNTPFPPCELDADNN